MRVRLTDDEEGMLHGEAGQAARIAMRLLCRVAPLYGADRLLEVTRAHIDGCILEGEVGPAFATMLADLGGQVRVPTTLNVISMDREGWRHHGMDEEYAGRAFELGNAYVRMGARPSFTCAPYQVGELPALGEQIAWSESNAVAFANSALGARTNRYGDYLDIACALTGRAPAAGLHLDEGRRATVLVRLTGIPAALMERDDFYPLLGYVVGGLVDTRVAVVDGLDAAPTTDQLKALLAAAASSGSVALLHLAGITPEASTVDEALGGQQPAATLEVTLNELRAAFRGMTTLESGRVDLVAFGSPHASLEECREIARLAAGREAAHGVQVFVTTSRAVRQLLARSGELEVLERFGATVTADTCIVVAPLVRPGATALMTNSGKYAHYGPGLLGLTTTYGSTAECVESAVRGRVTRLDSPWLSA
jgi:predicted aconitase